MRARASLMTACALAIALAACGDERTFTAEEFVDAINAQGAEVTLGKALTAGAEATEVNEIRLTSTLPSPTGSRAVAPAKGVLLMLEDKGAAEDELERCEAAPEFICFRAANAVMRFEELFPEEQARISSALQAIATD